VRPAQQTQENCLQDVLGIGRIAGDAVRRAEYQSVVRTEGALEFVGDGDRRILFYQYASQGTPPCSWLSPVKTKGVGDYYMGDRRIFVPVGPISYGLVRE